MLIEAMRAISVKKRQADSGPNNFQVSAVINTTTRMASRAGTTLSVDDRGCKGRETMSTLGTMGY